MNHRCVKRGLAARQDCSNLLTDVNYLFILLVIRNNLLWRDSVVIDSLRKFTGS